MLMVLEKQTRSGSLTSIITSVITIISTTVIITSIASTSPITYTISIITSLITLIITNIASTTRSGSDTHSTSRVLVTIVQLSFEAGDWAGLNKRWGQSWWWFR